MKNSQLAAVAIAVVFWVGTSVGRSAPPTSRPPVDEAERDFPKNEKGEPVLGSIRPLTSLLGARLLGESTTKDLRASDVMIDLKQARIEGVLFTGGQAGARDRNEGELTLPWSSLSVSLDGTLSERKAPHDSVRRAQPDGVAIMRWSQIRNIQVTNNEGSILGNVADFAVMLNDGHVAYAAVAGAKSTNDDLHPVPLSALVLNPQQKTWLLELPADIFENTKAFSAKSWPKVIDRGWLEYVHVRYGRSPFDGVRTSTTSQEGKARQR